MSNYQKPNFVKNYKPHIEDRVELKNGRFLDVINGRYFEQGTSVFIREGRIEAVAGPAEKASYGSSFTVDLNDKTAIPGLFNTHCHIGMTIPSQVSDYGDLRLSKRHHERQLAKNMEDCVSHGVTVVRDAWMPNLQVTKSLKENIASGKMPGPRIFQSIAVGPLGGYLTEEIGLPIRLLRRFAGWPVVAYDKKESGVVAFPVDASESQVREAVDKAVDERGADFIKIGEQRENMINLRPDAAIMTTDQLKALVDQSNRRGLKSTIHHLSVESFRRGLECRVSSLAHAPFDSDLTEADVEAFVAADGIIEPTATVGYDVCWKIKGDPMRDHPEMDKVTEFRKKTFVPLMEEFWIPELLPALIKAFEKVSAGKFKMLRFIDVSGIFQYYSPIVSHGTANIRKLFEGGACMGCGNDGGVPPCTPAMVKHELMMLDIVLNGNSSSPGFSGADAARIATINSARALGLEDRFGSIEPGKIADLVIVDGDPLENIDVIGSRAEALFMDGKLLINNCGLEVQST